MMAWNVLCFVFFCFAFKFFFCVNSKVKSESKILNLALIKRLSWNCSAVNQSSATGSCRISPGFVLALLWLHLHTFQCALFVFLLSFFLSLSFSFSFSFSFSLFFLLFPSLCLSLCLCINTPIEMQFAILLSLK